MIWGWYRLLLFWQSAKNKNSMARWNFSQHRTIWGWKFQNAIPRTIFIRPGPNFMLNTAVMWEYKAMDILAICQNLKKNVSLWNFNIGVNGKPKMRLIVERNGRKFGTWGTTVHMWRALLMPNSLSLVWGHSVHIAQLFLIPRFSKHYSFNSFHQILAKLHTKYHNLWLYL